MTKNPMVTLAERQRSCVEMGETSRRTTITATLQLPNGSLSSLKDRKARLEFAKKSTVRLRNKILRSYETKIEVFDVKNVKHGGGIIMLWGSFSGAGTE